MKKSTLLVPQKVLSKDEMKDILGGLKTSGNGCLAIGASCNDDVQCCSVCCGPDSSSSSTGKSCQVS